MNSVGIVTARDHLTIQWTEHDVWATVQNFISLDPEIARAAYKLGKDVRDWKVHLAQGELNKTGPEKSHIVPILYRPFDVRYTYFTGKSKGFHCMPRGEVMQHMLKENIGLITVRKAPPDSLFNYFFVSENIISNGSIRSDNQSIDTFFPLYLYHERKKNRSGGGITMMLFEPEVPYGSGKKFPNIAPKIFETLQLAYKRQLSPEDIFYYIYGVLYSNAYRKKYAEFLKTDFPRVPFTSDVKLFKSIAKKGEELVALHLLKSKKLGKPIAHCEGEGENRVEKITYDEKKKRVYFNPSQYFAGVAKEVWEYHIGGYQVAEKWLKDRKGRVLSSEEVSHYCKVVTALAETIKVQSSLDELFEEVEKNILEVIFSNTPQ